MSEFVFDFGDQPDDEQAHPELDAASSTAATATDHGCESLSLANFRKQFEPVYEGEAVPTTGPIGKAQLLQLRYVSPPFLPHLQNQQQRQHEEEADESSGGRRKDGKDMVDGVYLGGLKVWSCANDLCDFVASPTELQVGRPTSVLELGCGHGLPCIAALASRLDSNETSPSLWRNVRTFAFHDFNKEVIEKCTKVNVALNLTQRRGNSEDGDDGVDLSLCFGFGDWSTFRPSFGSSEEPATFGCVLGSDVTYDPTVCRALCSTLQRLLTPQLGFALIATKRFYFGTRGGLLELRSAVKQSNDAEASKRNANRTEAESSAVYGLRWCETPLWESEASGSSMERVIVMVTKDLQLNR